MLYAGHKLVGTIFLIPALISVHHSLRYLSAEIRIFAAAFDNSAPARIAAYIHHRAEHPVDAARSCFNRSNARAALDQIHIPGCRQCQRHWEHSLITVNDVHTEDQRNAGAGFKSNLLALAQQLRISGSV